MAALRANAGAPTGAAAAQDAEELGQSCEWVDSLFDWFFSDEIAARLSEEDYAQLGHAWNTWQQAPRSMRDLRALSNSVDTVVASLKRIADNADLGSIDGADDGYGQPPADMDEYMPRYTKTQVVAPHKIVVGLAATVVILWILGIFGCLLEVFLGEQWLLAHPMVNPLTRPNDETHLHHAPWYGGIQSDRPDMPGFREAAHTEAIENSHAPPMHHRRLQK